MQKAHPLTGYDPICTRDWPLRLGGSTGYVGLFGWTRDGGTKRHNGLDLLCKPGSPVYAMHDGLVSQQYGLEQEGGKGYGRRFYLDATDSGAANVQTLYAHLSDVAVKPGQFVRVGWLVGWSGRSGNCGLEPNEANPDHLHIGVKIKGEWTDPAIWLGIPQPTRS